jgi:hypothetical protein
MFHSVLQLARVSIHLISKNVHAFFSTLFINSTLRCFLLTYTFFLHLFFPISMIFISLGAQGTERTSVSTPDLVGDLVNLGILFYLET